MYMASILKRPRLITIGALSKQNVHTFTYSHRHIVTFKRLLAVDESSARERSEPFRSFCLIHELWVFILLGYVELRSVDQVSMNNLGYSGSEMNKLNKQTHT